MQPIQLGLIPEPYPRPPAALVEQLPADAVATAITLLAGVIAKASVPARMAVATDD